MNLFDRALAAVASLEALAAERRDLIAAQILAVIEAAHGGAGLSEEEIDALDEQLRQRVGSDEEVEAIFRRLLR